MLTADQLIVSVTQLSKGSRPCLDDATNRLGKTSDERFGGRKAIGGGGGQWP